LRAREALRDHRAKADPEGFNPKSENDPAPVTSSRSIAAPMNPAAAKRFLAQRRVAGNENVEDLEPTFAGRIAAMIDAAPPEIRDQIKIESGFRSRSHQARLFQRAIQKYGSANAAARNVAPPGRSQHNFGRAADLKYG